ncbi:NAD(P)-dependent oxidoreductase [Paraburkholderia oxyphila]|uniref:NAD(P)-dependent oxidoreductase n=1 Tax=Paraburkholderia oxyphila TaxID=614212 RepID=UPI000481E2C8|nr:NAD(P)-dependent oxidoreductase [Paraburkholderia oxyphila]
MKPMRVGFCGLGLMGVPMARRLLGAGVALRVWNRSPNKAWTLAAASRANCTVCSTPAEVARQADLIVLCLTDGAAVDAVTFGAEGLAVGAGTAGAAPLIVDHSSVAPSLTRTLAVRWHAATGGAWVDAPVSGGTSGAAAGTLAIMAGGNEDAVKSIEPLAAHYAARVTRMGDIGTGQATKLANQTIVATAIAALAEATLLARRAGIDAGRIPEALRGGWADSVLLQTVQPRMLAPVAQATGTIRTMLKDFDAIQALAHETGAPLPLAGLVRQWLARAVEAGYGDADISQIVQVPMSG